MNVKEFCVSTSARSGRQLIGGEISLTALHCMGLYDSICTECVCCTHTSAVGPRWVYRSPRPSTRCWSSLCFSGNCESDRLSVRPTCAHLGLHYSQALESVRLHGRYLSSGFPLHIPDAFLNAVNSVIHMENLIIWFFLKYVNKTKKLSIQYSPVQKELVVLT